MFNTVKLRKNLVLLLFSISIFFSFVNFFYLELRFIYLFLIIFIFFEKNLFNKISKNIIYLSIFSFIFFTIHYYLNININFNNSSIYDFSSLKVFLQILIIGISIFLINYNKKILLSNLKKIFDIFIYIFLSSILIYNLLNRGILLDTLYNCDLGFFYYTKFIFYENSHFGIIAVTVILNFIYNINYYLKNKILLLLNLIFIFFAYGNFSLSFYLASLFSLVLIFVSYKSLDKLRVILLILFLMLSNFFFFYGNTIYEVLSAGNSNLKYCNSKAIKLHNKYELSNNPESLFKGSVLQPKEKFKDILNNDLINLSTSVYVYSLYTAKRSLFTNPFGYGMHNYNKFREKIDKTIKVSEGYHVGGVIVFEENYMPRIIASVLNFNLNSGSNNFSKIIVELGIFGILLITCFLLLLFSKKINDETKFLLLPLIFFQLFIRGAGYFNFGFLIISIILLLILFQNIFYKNEK